jgi:hypothetical protein
MIQGNELDRIPHWLRQMRGWEETPQWLLRFIEQTEGMLSVGDLEESLADIGFQAPDGSAPRATRESRRAEEAPPRESPDEEADWFGGAFDHSSTDVEPARPPSEEQEVGELAEGESAGTEEEAVPEWLAGLEDGFPEEEGEPGWVTGPEVEIPQEGETDWLTRAEEAFPEEAETAAAPEGEGLPEWLAGLDVEAPDWLTAATEGEPEDAGTSEEEEPIPGQEAVPDWLGAPENVPSEETVSAVEAEDVGMPEWLADIEEGTAPEGETVPPGEETVPDWLTDLEGAPSEKVELAAESAGIPDWLAGIDEGVSTAIEEPVPEEAATSEEEVVPDWLAGAEALAEGEPTPPDEEVEPDWLADLEGVPAEDVRAAAEQAGVSDWLDRADEGVTAEAPVSQAGRDEAPTEAEAALPEEGTGPDWLADLEGVSIEEVEATSERLDWLAAQDEGAAAAADASGPGEDAVPDWLTDLGVPSEPESAPEGLADLEEVAAENEAPLLEEAVSPDWLVDLEATPAEEEVSSALLEETDLDEWFADTEEATGSAAAETESGEIERVTPEGPASPEAEPGLPDWLFEPEGEAPEAGMPVAEGEEPDWRAELGKGTPADVEPVGLGESETEGMPEWLVDMAAEEDEKAADEGIPEWLADMDEGPQDEGEPTPAEARAPVPEGEMPAPEEVPVEETSAEEGPIPEWLQGLEEAPVTDQPSVSTAGTDWLKEIEDMSVPEELISGGPAEPAVPEWVQTIGIEGDIATPEIGTEAEDEAEIPSWLRDAVPEGGAPTEEWEAEAAALQDALSLSADDQVGVEDMPEWIDELADERDRPAEGVLPAETSGPLAGLRGVLNPEPLLAILPKATYKPVPPVTEADRAEAGLIRQMLADSVSRPTRAPRSAGRAVLATLGRWVLYLVLLAVILVSPMQRWVRPPEQLAVQSFYNEIEQVLPGTSVLLVLDYDASLDGELTPLTRAILWHLLRKDIGVVTVSLTPQGVAMVQDLFDENRSATPGVDYLNLGYVPAHPAALQAFVSNPLGGVTLLSVNPEPAGTSIGQQIDRLEDWDLIVTVSGEQDHIRWWIEQVGSQTGVKILAGVSMGVAPYIQPYYSETGSGQIKGMLAGLGAVVRYEQLSDAKFTPSALPNYIVQANAQLFLVLIVVISGVSSVIARRRHRGAL